MNKDLKYLLLYIIGSSLLLAWSIYDSVTKSFNFLSFLVEFTDGYKLGILINSIGLSFITTCKIIQRIMFGELRIIEVEHLVEKLPIFSINLLFNLAADDSNLLPNVFLLSLSIAFKVFHIILMDRLDYFNLGVVNNLFNYSTKLSILLKYGKNSNFWANIIIIILDFSIAKFLVFDVFQGVNSVTCLLFGFQFAIQGVEALTFFCKLLLTIYELAQYRLEEDIQAGDDDDDDDQRFWDNKAYFNKAIDIASSSLKALSHISFIYLLTFHSGLSLPISLLQGTYFSIVQTYTEITHLFSFIELSKRFDSQLPTATQDELDQTDNLCIICREDMYSIQKYEEQFGKPLNSRKTAKRLRCGHILHMGCLKEWLERSDSCPLCRSKVFDDSARLPTAPTQQAANRNIIAQRDAIVNNLEVDEPMNGAPVEIPGITAFQQNQGDNEPLLNENNDEEPANRDIESVDETGRVRRPTSGRQTPTRTFPLESSISNVVESTVQRESMDAAYQTIELPNTALIPPNWILLPLERLSDSDGYRVSYSTRAKGHLRARNNESLREFNLIRPS
jgi:E3 ubiquitin-protein ligase synoviolin